MSIDTLGLGALQVLFLTAALLPTLVVELYRRFKVPERRKEIDDVMHLAFGTKDGTGNTEWQTRGRQILDRNPYVTDLDDAFSRCHRPGRYVAPVGILAVVNLTVASIGYAWVRVALEPTAPSSAIGRISPVIVMALAGGYVWSLYQIVSRARSGALAPDDLYEVILGFVASAPVGYAFSLLTADVAGFGAFAASAFPVRETSRLIQQFTLKQAFAIDGARAARPTERSLGAGIDGVGDETLVRLRELRIRTVLDMAYSDPIMIMLQTGYSMAVIIDWIDQSILSLYAGDLRPELARRGIRCSLDACEFVEQHGLWDAVRGVRGQPADADLEALTLLAASVQVEPTLLHDLFLRFYADPQVGVLRHLWYIGGVPKAVGGDV